MGKYHPFIQNRVDILLCYLLEIIFVVSNSNTETEVYIYIFLIYIYISRIYLSSKMGVLISTNNDLQFLYVYFLTSNLATVERNG